MPDAAALVEAVREFLEGDVIDVTDGRVRYHARVAANVLAIVERELRGDAEQSTAHGRALAALGVSSDAELSAAIRDGTLDGRLDEVRRTVTEGVRAKLNVANPRYLDGPLSPAE